MVVVMDAKLVAGCLDIPVELGSATRAAASPSVKLAGTEPDCTFHMIPYSDTAERPVFVTTTVAVNVADDPAVPGHAGTMEYVMPAFVQKVCLSPGCSKLLYVLCLSFDPPSRLAAHPEPPVKLGLIAPIEDGVSANPSYVY